MLDLSIITFSSGADPPQLYVKKPFLTRQKSNLGANSEEIAVLSMLHSWVVSKPTGSPLECRVVLIDACAKSSIPVATGAAPNIRAIDLESNWASHRQPSIPKKESLAFVLFAEFRNSCRIQPISCSAVETIVKSQGLSSRTEMLSSLALNATAFDSTKQSVAEASGEAARYVALLAAILCLSRFNACYTMHVGNPRHLKLPLRASDKRIRADNDHKRTF
jgi:hypothetical protein